MSDLRRPFGIDLGMTGSAIAYLNSEGRPEVIENREGDKTTPSVIVFDPSGEIIVGREAKNEAVLNPDRVVEHVQRFMGSEGWQRTIDGIDWTPEKLSALILGKLARDASDAGVRVEDVVIAHPAYFTCAERAATRAAGTIAGLHVLGLIEEPVAAAYAYCMTADEEVEGNVLVYDLGGSTFDVCVISIRPSPIGKDIRVVVTEGQRALGGKDWDARVLAYALSELSTKTGMDLDAYSSGAMGEESATRYREMLQELTGRVEDAKRALTQKPKARIPVAFEGARVTLELTREQFDEMTADLLLQTIDLTRQALEEAREKGVDMIDAVLLVGGSSKMPQVAAAVTGLVGLEPRLFQPDLAVAKGAAFIAMLMELNQLLKPAAPLPPPSVNVGPASSPPPPLEPAPMVQDHATAGAEQALPGANATSFTVVMAHALGVVAVDSSTTPPSHRMLPIIQAQTPLPCRETRSFGTYEDGQQSLVLEMKQGDSENPEDCYDLGQLNLTLSQAMPRGTAIEVTFTMDAEGLLAVTALQPDTGAVVSAAVQRPATMTADAIAAAAQQHAGSVANGRGRPDDLFALVGLDLECDDATAIRDAVARTRQRCSRGSTMGPDKVGCEQLLARLPEIERVLLYPQSRAALCEEVRATRAARGEVLHREVGRALALLLAGGKTTITKLERDALLKRYAKPGGLRPEQIDALITVPVVDGAQPATGRAAPLPASEARLLATNLAVLGCTDLYDFLGVAVDADAATIEAKRRERSASWNRTAKPTSEKTAALALVGRSAILFADPVKRASYDETLAQARLEPFHEDIGLALVDGELSQAQFAALIATAAEAYGLDAARAEAIIVAEARKRPGTILNRPCGHTLPAAQQEPTTEDRAGDGRAIEEESINV